MISLRTNCLLGLTLIMSSSVDLALTMITGMHIPGNSRWISAFTWGDSVQQANQWSLITIAVYLDTKKWIRLADCVAIQQRVLQEKHEQSSKFNCACTSCSLPAQRKDWSRTHFIDWNMDNTLLNYLMKIFAAIANSSHGLSNTLDVENKASSCGGIYHSDGCISEMFAPRNLTCQASCSPSIWGLVKSLSSAESPQPIFSSPRYPISCVTCTWLWWTVQLSDIEPLNTSCTSMHKPFTEMTTIWRCHANNHNGNSYVPMLKTQASVLTHSWKRRCCPNVRA